MFRKICIAVCCLVPAALMAQNTFKITAGATVKLTGGVIITLDNMHLDNDGTLSLAAGDGSFRFSGNTTTNILGSSLPLFDAIEIAKIGGAQLTLQRNISVVSGINFTSGLFNLNNNNVLLQPTALLSGESETSHITGTTGGFVEITNTLNAPASQNPGNLGAMITSSQNLGSTLIRRGHQAQPNGSNSSVNRYFDITPTNNTALNAALRFSYFDAELNSLNETSVVLWKSSDNVAWTEIGADSRNTTTNYVEKTGIADFSRWTLFNPSGALPIVFTFINARCENGKIIVTWKTAQEINSSRFDVERSLNGVIWTVAGSVPAAGYSASEKTYSYTDINPLPTVAMYRIAEYDVNGKAQYTGIVRSSCDGKDGINVWPNPVQDIAWLNITINSPSAAVVKLYDAKGSLILVQKTTLIPGSNQLPVPMKKLAQGIYELKVEYGAAKIKTYKLVKY